MLSKCYFSCFKKKMNLTPFPALTKERKEQEKTMTKTDFIDGIEHFKIITFLSPVIKYYFPTFEILILNIFIFCKSHLFPHN